ncbi:hypothetical protein RISK_004045 [Rhodopirellula islandica]|uniref:Uncharacterized protein n=1 Tax=Rhodopirellula islandica TaxID=595434 RepID=A0A0J1BAT1_RHOIS|nr:hypothetical protein RISK_004045 [Rhodopirellula islandica]
MKTARPSSCFVLAYECNPGTKLASAIKTPMVTAFRLNRQRRFNTGRMCTLARQSLPSPHHNPTRERGTPPTPTTDPSGTKPRRQPPFVFESKAASPPNIAQPSVHLG